jgi:hypothetical protein
MPPDQSISATPIPSNMTGITTSSNEADPTDHVNDKEEIATNDKYAHGTRLAAIVVSLLLGMFLVALDNVGYSRTCDSHNARRKLTMHVNSQTILGTAIPKITDEFHDLNKVSWYGAAYFMTFGGGEFLVLRNPG